MSFIDSATTLWKEVGSIVEDEGLSVYDLEADGSSRLRVFIEKNKGEKTKAELEEATSQAGVTSEDCTRICRRLMVFFEGEENSFGLSKEPEIEVSSPGINRHLRLPKHFENALGQRVKVVGEAYEDSEEAKKVESDTVVGTLSRVESEVVRVVDELSSKTIRVSLPTIRKAQVAFKF